ncbi:MAG: hypothetical protein GY801_28795 [bacterium]|nr:hypothetical protein [bacterium]
MQTHYKNPAVQQAFQKLRQFSQHAPETLQQMLQELETRLNDSLPVS